MDDKTKLIVQCPNCGDSEFWENLHWRDGKQYCRACIAKVWKEDNKKRQK